MHNERRLSATVFSSAVRPHTRTHMSTGTEEKSHAKAGGRPGGVQVVLSPPPSVALGSASHGLALGACTGTGGGGALLRDAA